MNSPYELAMASLLGLGTTSSNDCYRHLITTFLAVCERRTREIQGNLRRQGFVGNERFLRARLHRAHERINCQGAHKISNTHIQIPLPGLGRNKSIRSLLAHLSSDATHRLVDRQAPLTGANLVLAGHTWRYLYGEARD